MKSLLKSEKNNLTAAQLLTLNLTDMYLASDTLGRQEFENDVGNTFALTNLMARTEMNHVQVDHQGKSNYTEEA